MIHKLSESMLANHGIIYSVRGWFPLEIVKAIDLIVCLLPSRKYNFLIMIINWLCPTTFLNNSINYSGVVTRSDHVFERSIFVLFVSVL